MSRQQRFAFILSLAQSKDRILTIPQDLFEPETLERWPPGLGPLRVDRGGSVEQVAPGSWLLPIQSSVIDLRNGIIEPATEDSATERSVKIPRLSTAELHTLRGLLLAATLFPGLELTPLELLTLADRKRGDDVQDPKRARNLYSALQTSIGKAMDAFAPLPGGERWKERLRLFQRKGYAPVGSPEAGGYWVKLSGERPVAATPSAPPRAARSPMPATSAGRRRR